ncbi:MAG: hypothetical protein SCJ94_08715 [Bacillota bacterium]|nr:hypothetical protein [Bacillota bacterium]MDW7730069.1 hypothetical protein [Bacillota bacterium]
MTATAAKNIWSYLGKFTLTHVVTISLMAVIFNGIQGLIPPDGRIALDFFEPYKLGLSGAVIEALRGIVIALVLFPFYNLIVRSRHGKWLLFAAIWGLVLFASMEPKPGTIEGMIYTETTLMEHLIVLFAVAVQVSVFSWLFLKWERGSDYNSRIGGNDEETEVRVMFFKGKGYFLRFTLLHVIIYILVGSLFYQIAGYEEALATMDEFSLWRDLESFGMVAAVFLGQIARGAIIAMFVAPFYIEFMNKRYGWLLLFGLLFGLKVLGAIIVVPTFPIMWADYIVGIPEITAQTFLFSLLFFAWEKRRIKKNQLSGVRKEVLQLGKQ